MLKVSEKPISAHLGRKKRLHTVCSLLTGSLIPLQEDRLPPREQELKDLKESLQDTQPVGVLVDACRTMDQVRAF